MHHFIFYGPHLSEHFHFGYISACYVSLNSSCFCFVTLGSSPFIFLEKDSSPLASCFSFFSILSFRVILVSFSKEGSVLISDLIGLKMVVTSFSNFTFFRSSSFHLLLEPLTISYMLRKIINLKIKNASHLWPHFRWKEICKVEKQRKKILLSKHNRQKYSQSESAQTGEGHKI